MFSDIVTNKEAAKNDIKGALFGLLIVVGAVVLLNTINTNLTNVDLNIGKADVDTQPHLQELFNRITTQINNCTEPECTIEVCSAIGDLVGSCETWCNAQGNGSEYLPGSSIGFALDGNFWDRCLVKRDEQGSLERQVELAGGIIGPTSCEIGSEIIFTIVGTGVVRQCSPIKTTNQPIDDSINEEFVDYICIQPGVRGACDYAPPSGFGWFIGNAEAYCKTKNGELVNDPSNIGRGICRY